MRIVPNPGAHAENFLPEAMTIDSVSTDDENFPLVVEVPACRGSAICRVTALPDEGWHDGSGENKKLAQLAFEALPWQPIQRSSVPTQGLPRAGRAPQ